MNKTLLKTISIIFISFIIFFFMFFSYFNSKNASYKNLITKQEKLINDKQIEIDKLIKRTELKNKIAIIKNNAYQKKEKIYLSKINNLKNIIKENNLNINNSKTNSVLDNKNIENNINQINQYIQNDSKNIPNEKELDIKFYSQFPLDISTGIKYEEPYQNFCEEASILNGYYYLSGKEVNMQEYNEDLLKLKEIQDILFDGGYMHTTMEQNLDLLIAFNEENLNIHGKIIKNPSVEIIKENISNGNPVIVPVYGKGLTNNLFTEGGPLYHNLLIKGYTDEIFITNEVGVSKGDGFKYKIDELMENIFNYDENLYPDNFTKGEKEILVLYK